MSILYIFTQKQPSRAYLNLNPDDKEQSKNINQIKNNISACLPIYKFYERCKSFIDPAQNLFWLAEWRVNPLHWLIIY